MSETSADIKQGRAELEFMPDETALIRLGDSSEPLILLTIDRIESIYELIHDLKNKRPRGLIITGSGNEMFCAGLDIHLLPKIEEASDAEALSRAGQNLCQAIASLPFPTVAAISGPCLGGGCEIALACAYRIISEHKSSLIGFPEVGLGLMPGFGGTQRLPRLIGLSSALDMVLSGKPLRPAQALNLKLVDELLPVEKVLPRASSIIRNPLTKKASRPALLERLLTKTSQGRRLVLRKTSRKINSLPDRLYPALPAILDAMRIGLEGGAKAGLKAETEGFGRLLVSRESRNLVRVFSLKETSRTLGRSARRLVDHVQAVVIGAGQMGAEIAGVLARGECSVILKDTSDDVLGRAIGRVRAYLDNIPELTSQEKSFILNRIEVTSLVSSNTGNASFAIEAVPEDLELKKKVLGDIAQLMPQDAILLTNTASLSVTEIARGLPSPDRIAGLHFFKPAGLMPCVEIIRGTRTSDKTIAILAALTCKAGKFPIVVKDAPGWVGNRLLAALFSESLHLLEKYGAESIDQAALAFGMISGPFRMMDDLGLEICHQILTSMEENFGERFSAPAYLQSLLAAGRRGKTCGSGFYDYARRKKGDQLPDMRAVLGLQPPSSGDAQPIQECLYLSMVNEAVRVLDDSVAGFPGAESAAQINLASVSVLGFPALYAGVLNFADQIGLPALLDKLTSLEQALGGRFQPAPGILDRIRRNRRFC